MILIVEDNQQVRKMIRSFVEDFDKDVCECADGDEAFEAFQKHRPEWVLMDLAMQRVNGLDATREIVSVYPDAKIAIVTNHDDTDIRLAATNAGASAYIIKENLTDLCRLFA